MRISDTKAIDICKNRPNKNVVGSCVSTQNEIKRHIDGTNYEALIKQLDGRETKQQITLRKSMSKPATIPITKIIIDELNRWTNAQGTEKAYHFSDKEKEKDFRRNGLSKVWHGKSMTDFINTDLKESLDTEFNGFYVVTKGSRVIIGDQTYEYRDGIEVGVDKKTPYQPYIMFVSIDDTLDFLKNGDKIEYLAYKYGNRVVAMGDGKEKIVEQYRFLDDDWSRIIEKDGDIWSISKEKDFKPVKNQLDYVPAVQISNTKLNVNVDGVMKSQLTFLVSMLDRYLEKDSELTQAEILHAFPKHWMTGIKCPECSGDKFVVNDPKKSYFTSDLEIGEHMTCPVCSGEGSIVIKDSSQVAKVPQVLPEGFRPFSTEIGGYIVPPIESLEYLSTDKRQLGDDIIYAGTSNKNIVSNKFKTATENNQNLKTLEDKIDDRLRNIEMVEIFLTNAIAEMHNVFKKTYKGCTIKYSRRLFYKTETEILTDIETAKRSGMPLSYIKQMQIELYRSKYVHAPLELELAIKLTDVENFVGFTYTEVKDNEYISEEEKKYKFYFNDIVESIMQEHIDFLSISNKELKKLITNKVKEYGTSNQKDESGRGDDRVGDVV